MKNIRRILSLFLLTLVPAFPVFAEPAVGKTAPAFSLPDTQGQKRSLAEYKGKYVILEWINHGCPFVIKHYDSNNMQTLQKEMTAKGYVWLSIASSAEGKEGHMTAAEWNTSIEEKGSAATAVLLDPDGKVGRLYGAKTTPHMYIIDPKGALIYKGAIDNKPSTDPADVPGAHNYIRASLENAAAGRAVQPSATQPYGCSVKYKK